MTTRRFESKSSQRSRPDFEGRDVQGACLVAVAGGPEDQVFGGGSEEPLGEQVQVVDFSQGGVDFAREDFGGFDRSLSESLRGCGRALVTSRRPISKSCQAASTAPQAVGCGARRR